MKKKNLGYAHGIAVNIYIVYELKSRSTDSSDFTLSNGLFGAVKLTKDVKLSLQIIIIKVTEFVSIQVVNLVLVILLVEKVCLFLVLI